MTIRKTKPEELDKVLEFYKTYNYSWSPMPDDLILCAQKNKQIIAVVRLCYENHTLVLRGMQVDKKFQREGIGRLLLKELDKIIEMQTCYCISYGHLENFYSSIGFKKIDDKKVPDHLSKRLERYRQRDPNMTILKR